MRAYNLSVSGSLDVSGNITGSNISASGTVYADSFSSPTSGESGVISFADDLSITGDVTASGHISASSTSTGSFGRVEASTVEGTFGSTSRASLSASFMDKAGAAVSGTFATMAAASQSFMDKAGAAISSSFAFSGSDTIDGGDAVHDPDQNRVILAFGGVDGSAGKF